ncbi:MAG: hypothetical protein H7101_04970 [Deinococcales bacterium]|nr:hypothetical protein [Chitinophagaceae bacterium]
MRLVLLCFTVFFTSICFGQYYYYDVVSNTLSNQQFKLIKQAKVKKIQAISYDPNGEITQGFTIEQELSPDFRRSITNTILTDNTNSILTITYENNRIKKTVDVNHKVETSNSFIYNDKGLLVNITSNTSDTAVKATSNEVHLWSYNVTNQPTVLQKIKNKTDTTIVNFVYDEKGNVGEERWKRKGRILETYYYYYNDKNLVTDIVRFNSRSKQLLPDFLYEYDDKNRIIKMTQITNGGSNYFIWMYTYNDKGLKQAETCYNKQKQLLGKVNYRYEYQ